MEIKKNRLNIIILIILLVIASTLLGMRYLAKPQVALVSSYSNPQVADVEREANTILMIQATQSAGCKTSVVQLTEAQLLALPQQQFTTHHSWATEPDTFTGPLLEDVLKLACDNPKKISLKALNNYGIDLDFSRASPLKLIVAHTVNKKRLSVREKGPLWLMAPIDDLNIQKDSLDPMMVWQLNNIVIINTDEVS